MATGEGRQRTRTGSGRETKRTILGNHKGTQPIGSNALTV